MSRKVYSEQEHSIACNIRFAAEQEKVSGYQKKIIMPAPFGGDMETSIENELEGIRAIDNNIADLEKLKADRTERLNYIKSELNIK